MPHVPPADAPRCAVVDLGSNSVRLVVFEGRALNPVAIFNEKAVLRLGRGLQQTGRLNEQGVAQALGVLRRYATIARAMGAMPFEVLATAAVRDAVNGPAFVAELQTLLPGVPIRVLSGEAEAGYSAEGLLCGIPAADGVLADIGGGSLELVRLERGRRGVGRTLRLGVIRLSERAGHDLLRAREIAEQDLADVPWLAEGAGRDLYLVGGAWRAIARIHIARVSYPLNIVHHLTIPAEAARELAGTLAAASPRLLEKMAGVPRRRVEDVPYAAVVLRRLLRATGARQVVFSANGLREGWYMQRVDPALRAQDPLLAAARDVARGLGRDPALPPALLAWTAPLFAGETSDARLLREAACWMSDLGSHDHPEYRAEQAFLRVLRQPGVGLDHPARAFLALAVAVRYEADLDAAYVAPARLLLDPDAIRRATLLGLALRLAYMLSAGTLDLLAGTALLLGSTLTLRLEGGVPAGESVLRRLDRLGVALGLAAEIDRPA